MKRLQTYEWLLMIAATIYLLSPVDIIPELLLGPLGLVDDTAAAGILVALLLKAKKSKEQPIKVNTTGTYTTGV